MAEQPVAVRNNNNDKAIDLGFKVLSILIIPALLWVNSISVQNALTSQTVQSHEEGIKKLKEQVVQVQLNEQSLKNIKEELKMTREVLAEIRTLIP